eukprot:scaffold74171_cov69-Phaeocystis_antarctica.AAC.3
MQHRPYFSGSVGLYPRSTHTPLSRIQRVPARAGGACRGMKGPRGALYPLPTDDAAAEHVRVLPQGPLRPPAPRGPRVEPRGARAGHNRARRVAQAVPSER